MLNRFKKGDMIRRVMRSHMGVVQGNVYTVDTLVDSARVTLKGIKGIFKSMAFEPLALGAAARIAYSPKADEADPNGISQNAPGAKLDAGKLLPRLVLGEFARALEAVAEVGTVGARKYTPRGWLEVPNGQDRYAEAAMRHQIAVWKGKRLDDGVGGTGKLHKAQVLWNLLAELELELRREEANG